MELKIDEAFLGSCNNGRIEDLRVGAEVIKGKKVAERRPIPRCAGKPDYLPSGISRRDFLTRFMEAGAIVMNPNCSVCWGSCQGVIGENEVLISTGTRNFKGRAGHPSSKVYLGSAATVTASAITERLRWQVRCDANYKCSRETFTESSKFPAKVAKGIDSRWSFVCIRRRASSS